MHQASSLADLRRITFDPNGADLAIREALHRANGRKADCFANLHEKALKRLLKSRFDDLKRKREKALRGGNGKSARDWSHDVKLDNEGGIRPLLTNLILFFAPSPEMDGRARL